MENVLIASLGDSPIVVTAMYDLLTRQDDLEINKVVALHPYGYISLAFDYIKEALNGRCEVISEPLPFEDANRKEDSFAFLHTLYRLLNDSQKNGDAVYLSLAGGRKNMSALMALLVPLFPCVKGLYHVIDKDENSSHSYHFKSIEEIIDLSDDDRLSYFSFDDDQLKRLNLIKIPYGKQQQVSEGLRSLLFTITEEELGDLWDKDPQQAEMIETYRRITQKPTSAPVLQIRLTERVKDEYERMRRHNAPQALRFARCFEQMKDPYHLYEAIKDSGLTRDSYSFHFYKRRRTVERSFYHTEPQNIHLLSKRVKVDTVVISGLAIEQSDGSYKPSADELLQKFDPAEATVPLEAILPAGASAESTSMEESALIVPLGNTPMIATQLYTLLTYQGNTIRKVILLYPANSQEIKNGAALLEKAFEDEGKGISCIRKGVQGYADIDTKEACVDYEKALEEAIDAVCKDYQVELALSGGRKGMAALAMFVAQRKGIRYVYHTLITDKQLSDQVEQETEIEDLRSPINEPHRNNRLFLREYEGNGPYTKFVLFKVPVLPAKG